MRAVGLLVAGPVLALAACTGPSPSSDGKADAAAEAPAAPTDAFRAQVVRVVDGDTLIARRAGRELRVRLIGVDAPESVRPDAPVECFGKQAGQALARLLPVGETVQAAYQSGGERDQFGRELWDVWLPSGTFVQSRLVGQGAAEARAYPPQTAHADVLDRVERRARAEGAGMWGQC
jgi:micrococcal nuclease